MFVCSHFRELYSIALIENHLLRLVVCRVYNYLFNNKPLSWGFSNIFTFIPGTCIHSIARFYYSSMGCTNRPVCTDYPSPRVTSYRCQSTRYRRLSSQLKCWHGESEVILNLECSQGMEVGHCTADNEQLNILPTCESCYSTTHFVRYPLTNKYFGYWWKVLILEKNW
jgi:hypothetical protein